MSRNFRVAYLAHSIRSDWNNGNAHFLRGLLRNMVALGHEVTIFEPANGWSVSNLKSEPNGQRSLAAFAKIYPDLQVSTYDLASRNGSGLRLEAFKGFDIVIIHEWNSPELVHLLLTFRDALGFRLLFHDTHHRASSSPAMIKLLKIDCFDGVIVFGDALRRIYREHFNVARVWTLHEGADTQVFYPQTGTKKTDDVVWIGNWGDNERSGEICEYLLTPAARLKNTRVSIYGVRYPEEGLAALKKAGVHYQGYLPNLDAPEVYSRAELTVHIPRQQYSLAMTGIPTIRVFEALACGIPLISAPWVDSEQLFHEGDFHMVRSGAEMEAALSWLLGNRAAAEAQAQRGLETVRARHTCRHRAEELTSFCEELFP